MADRPASDPAKFAAEFSPNHGDEGENVLFFDGSVQWSNDRVKGQAGYKNSGGWGGSCIYQFDMDAADKVDRAHAGPPKATVSRYDSVIYWRGN